MAGPQPIDQISNELWDAVYETNLRGFWWCTKHAAPHLKASKAGAIVNAGSTASLSVGHDKSVAGRVIGADGRFGAQSPLYDGVYRQGLALGIVMLSLVPLIGYGGQISLAPMAFAGVGALVIWVSRRRAPQKR